MHSRAGACALLLVISSLAPGAEILHVTPDGAGDYPTIQAAVDASSDGDVILLGDGVFTGDGNRDVVVYYKDLRIASESGDPARTVIDCYDDAGLHRAWLIRFNEMSIEGISMMGGDAGSGFGGAANVGECIVGFVGCIFTRNRALCGGAVAASMCEIEITSCTFYANEATAEEGGAALLMLDYGGYMRVSNAIAAFGTGGGAIVSLLPGALTLECCDIFGNEGGDYVGSITDLLGVDGNISVDPLFCDASGLDFRLHSDSPCAPDGECGLIGALPVGCGPTPSEETRWGRIKGLYRDR